MYDDVDFTNLMEKWKDHPPRDDDEGGLLSMAKVPTSVQAVMKDAKDDHKAAVRVACTHNHIHAHKESLLYHKIIHYQWV